MTDVDLQPQTLHLRVYNLNSFELRDRFDGTEYILPAAGQLDYPIDAAFHIFGWHEGVEPQVMKRHCQKRFGWNTPSMVKDGAADVYWEQLKFRPIQYRLVPEEVEGEPSPPDPEPREAAAAGEPKRRRNPILTATDEAQARHQ